MEPTCVTDSIVVDDRACGFKKRCPYKGDEPLSWAKNKNNKNPLCAIGPSRKKLPGII